MTNKDLKNQCKFCGFKKKYEKPFAIYKHKDAKVFLKRNGWKKFKEVQLVKVKGGIRVLPLNEIQLTLKV
jgi:hypothetical protein